MTADYDNMNSRLRRRFGRLGQTRAFKALAVIAALTYLGFFIYGIFRDALDGRTGQSTRMPR